MGAEQVVLRGYPVALGMSVVEHVEDWVREFRLIALAQESDLPVHPVPERLQGMVSHLTGTYARELAEPDRLRADAAERGDETVDLVYPVRPETPDAVRGWQAMLAEVDAYCAAEDLLTLQRTPDQVALGTWTTEEFLRQVDGLPPRTWAQWRAEHPQG